MFDLAVGVLGIPLFIFFLENSIDGIPNCVAASLARRLMIAPIGGFSIIVLIAMTVERYIAILHPYTYKTLATKGRLLKHVGVHARQRSFSSSACLLHLYGLLIYAIMKVTLHSYCICLH